MSSIFSGAVQPEDAVAEPGPAAVPQAAPQRREALRIAILIVAYNAESTLRQVLDRIPEPIWERVEEVFVFDDSSDDDTFGVGMSYKLASKRTQLNVFRNTTNLGYGGNQIRGYSYAIEQGYDVVVLLHGDGQYAPEVLPELLAPIEAGQADAVFGSRMMEPGAARSGGMPLYKLVGNRILTRFENAALGMSLSEFHSGYRAYRCAALAELPFERNTSDFHFDTEIIIQLHAAGRRIVEVPIPTYYGDEICYVDGMRYAGNVFRSVASYRLHTLGLVSRPRFDVGPVYRLKQSPRSSHAQLEARVGAAPRTVLDVGCGLGELALRLEAAGHSVVAVDRQRPLAELCEFVSFDLADGLPPLAGRRFDVILLADVLEHLAEPEALLRHVRRALAPGGRVLVSLPNAVHWSVRLQVLFGRWEYSDQGILDRTHLRFWTRSSALRLLRDAGFEPVSRSTTPIPWEKVLPGWFGGALWRAVEAVDSLLGRWVPGLFAYQNLFELRLGEEPR